MPPAATPPAADSPAAQPANGAAARRSGGAIPQRKDGARWDQLSLVREASNATRAQIMRAGSAPAFTDLAGYEFAGINTPWFTAIGGARKFIKGFYEGSPRTDRGPEPFIQGYNIPARQNGLDGPHVAKPSDQHPKRFGFYRVHHVVPGARDSRYPDALLLDYGLGGNGLSPAGVLRDYLVQVYPDDRDLLLGHAIVALFGLRLGFGLYFVLKRLRQHDFVG